MRRFMYVYIALVVLSQLVVWTTGKRAASEALVESRQRVATLDALSSDMSQTDQRVRLAYYDIVAAGDSKATECDPIVLIHGSPGQGNDFAALWSKLSSSGYRVIVPDLPGFGSSSKDADTYSILFHARAVVELLKGLGVERAHVAGWSMGGGVAMHIADMEPARVTTLSLIASIGTQETEGSRSYFMEHLKYRVGMAGCVAVYTGVPHFGVLGEARSSMAYRSLRNFSDTDMRPLAGILARMVPPTLVLHGRRDFLVPDWAAERHAAMLPDSRLVMLEASHFLPLLQAEETASNLLEFIGESERGGRPGELADVLASPRSHVFGGVGAEAAGWLRVLPWWVIVFGIGILTLWLPVLGVTVAATLVAGIYVDVGVAGAGVMAGRCLEPVVYYIIGVWERVRRGTCRDVTGLSDGYWRARLRACPPGVWEGVRSAVRADVRIGLPRVLARERVGVFGVVGYIIGAALGCVMVAIVQFVAALVICGVGVAGFRLDYEPVSGWGWMLQILQLGVVVGVAACVVWGLPYLLSWTGRRMLLARLTRLWRTEYWPTWMFYAPLAPYYLWLAYRTGHLLAYTACNPAIAGHGGVVGESKQEIQSGLESEGGCVLPCVAVETGKDAALRAAQADEYVRAMAELGGYPVIVKPDSGFRGYSVRVVRQASEFEAYFGQMRNRAILQKYHGGPGEIGVMWVRRLPSEGGLGGRDALTGSIFSITRKEFPYVRGDGVRTIEELIYSDPRLRCQAKIFLQRHGADVFRIPAPDERARLVQSGNHCQGTMFLDGGELVTPELERAIDRLAATFGARRCVPENGKVACGGLDIGRFDLRYESEADLRRGVNFAVIELNGTTGESTNVYDPNKSFIWRYRVLYRLWRHMFLLGRWRMDQGVRAMRVSELLKMLRGYYAQRTGTSMAD